MVNANCCDGLLERVQGDAKDECVCCWYLDHAYESERQGIDRATSSALTRQFPEFDSCFRGKHMKTGSDLLETLPATMLSSSQSPAVGARLPLRFSLLCAALRELVFYDLLASLGFKNVRAAVLRTKRRDATADSDDVIRVVDAVRTMCVLYFKKSFCLQRAFVATRLLRRLGVNATLVIGSQPAPIRSHAWVEVDGVPVINRTTHLAFYKVIDRW